jgi:hypothetical protein
LALLLQKRLALGIGAVTRMNALKGWIIFAWIALPTVMYGGYALLNLVNRGNALTPFQVTWFRAGHAHAGVLLLMALLYYTFMDKTSFTPLIKHCACAVLAVGILTQAGGFFVHMMLGSPEHASIGTTVTTIGAVLLTCAIAMLLYGLINARLE